MDRNASWATVQSHKRVKQDLATKQQQQEKDRTMLDFSSETMKARKRYIRTPDTTFVFFSVNLKLL